MAASISLSVWDYLVFGLMLVLSSAIGIYYGYKGRKQSTKEYLTASGNMHWLPISISLMASFLSAIALMGMPAEVYTYGAQYMVSFLSSVFIVLSSALIYAPIFYKTQVTSANEYLERRFSKGVRLVGCLLFILQCILYLAVAIFAPSLALQAVAGVPLAVSIISTGAVCIFYTTLGGMRGVVWTDVLQASIMVTGLVVVIIIGTVDVGGVGNVFEAAKEGGRLNFFNFNPDPTVRNTFWTLVVGGALAMIQSFTTSQFVVQRFNSTSSLRNVRKALFWNVGFMFLFLATVCFAGLVMYAVYAKCDPRSAGLIKSNDQIIPYFVVHRLAHLKGIPGLYTACLFSGALSSVSSVLNALAAVTLEDIVRRIHPNITESHAAIASKLIVCGYGVIVIAAAFLVSSVGPMVLQLAYSIAGVVGAPNFGMFTLGMLSSRANSKGAYIGVMTGIAMTSWISTGGILYPGDRNPLSVSVEGCSNLTKAMIGMNGTVPYVYKGYDFPLAKLYRISPLWYGAIGALSTISIGWIVSMVTRSFEKSEDVDPILLFDYKAIFMDCLPSRCKSSEDGSEIELSGFSHNNLDKVN